MSVAESLTLLDDVLEECEDDHVGLWSVIREVRKATPAESVVKATTLDLIRFLLSRRLIVAGFPTPDGKEFNAWLGTADQIVQGIAAQWDQLGRDPTGGEIVWFTTPGKSK